jgi:predicted Zn-dependent protease
MFRRLCFVIGTLLPFIVLASMSTVRADTVEVYPSLLLTKHTYDAPLNEQPFYGFTPKSEAMLAADQKFIEAVEKNTGREVGAEQFEAMGWNAVKNGDLSTAAKRFNQAWLLVPGRSATVHGLAIVVAGRFRDLDFAIELASAAAGLKSPLPALPGDRGGLLIRAGKPAQAIPFLEKATEATPNWINPLLNLATARFETGDGREACRQLAKVESLLQERPGARSPTIDATYQALSKEAQCGAL